MTFAEFADWRTRHALHLAPDESSVYWPNVTRKLDREQGINVNRLIDQPAIPVVTPLPPTVAEGRRGERSERG